MCYNNSEIVRVAFSCNKTKVALSRRVRLKSLTFLSQEYFFRPFYFQTEVRDEQIRVTENS